jgi:hypothetical protein
MRPELQAKMEESDFRRNRRQAELQGQINHGQSEIWLEGDGKELTPRRKLATNEVVNVMRRHCMAPHFIANSTRRSIRQRVRYFRRQARRARTGRVSAY